MTEMTQEEFWENEFKGEWWDKPAQTQSDAESMAARLTDLGFSYEDAKKWVWQVQGEAVLRERARVKKALDQFLDNGVIISENAYKDILGIPRNASL